MSWVEGSLIFWTAWRFTGASSQTEIPSYMHAPGRVSPPPAQNLSFTHVPQSLECWLGAALDPAAAWEAGWHKPSTYQHTEGQVSTHQHGQSSWG